MAQQLQSIKSLSSAKDKKLYIETLQKIYEELNNMSKIRSFALDNQRQHKIRITRLVINGKVNPKVTTWLNKNAKYDIVGIDDVPKDVIKRLKYGSNYLTKSDRKILRMLRKINKNRSEKDLIKDLSGNEKILNIKDYNKWIKNKNKYDIQDLDTIPTSVAGKAASVIQKQNKTLSKKKKYSRLSSTTRGVFVRSINSLTGDIKSRNIRINRLIKGTSAANMTIAHEIGHSYDLMKNNFKKPSNEVIEDMKKLAGKINKPAIPFDEWDKIKEDEAKFKLVNKSVKAYMKYRTSSKELFADSFAYLVYNPSYVKKNAKSFYNYVIKRQPKLKTIIGKSSRKVITNIVKRTKGDKKYLSKERIKNNILKYREVLNNLKNRKKIGKVTLTKIKKIENKIKELNIKLK